MKSLTAKTPKAVIFLIIAFLCPTEFSLFVAGLRIPPHRAALLILLPLALLRLLQQKDLKIRAFDLMVIAFSIWTVAIFMYHQGSREGLVYGGSLALDGLGSYLVARVWIRNAVHFQSVLKLMGTVILLAALIALPETLFGHLYTHDLLKSLTGYSHPVAIEKRLGLTRAYGTFDHPIHYGTFCASLLAMFWYASASKMQRWKRAALLSGATFLGLSSAPLLCLGLQAILLVWERLTRGVASRTTLTLAVLTGLYIGASIVMTRSPVAFIATGLTLDPWTGYYRLQIWHYGIENVVKFPWTGIGLNEWERPWWMASSTIDAFWLVIAMREGVPGIVLILTSMALMMRSVVTRGLKNPVPGIKRISRGWIMSLIALTLVGCTVHYWNVMYAYFFFFLGLSGWLADPMRARVRAAKAATPTGTHTWSRKQRGRYPAKPLPPVQVGDYGPLPTPA